MNFKLNSKNKGIIIIPCFNEEKNIEKVIRELYNNLKDLKMDVIFINDASYDNTECILLKHNLNYINHPINLGYNYSIQTGLKYALKKGYDLFVIMDGDGQHLVSEIKKIKKEFEKGYDVVIGSRFKKGFFSTYKIPLSRKLGMIFFSILTTIITGKKFKDTSSGFQIFNKKAAKVLIDLYEAKYPDAEVIVILNLLKFKVKEMPVIMREREEGSSMISGIYYPLRVFLGTVIGVLRYFLKKVRRQYE